MCSIKVNYFNFVSSARYKAFAHSFGVFCLFFEILIKQFYLHSFKCLRFKNFEQSMSSYRAKCSAISILESAKHAFLPYQNLSIEKRHQTSIYFKKAGNEKLSLEVKATKLGNLFTNSFMFRITNYVSIWLNIYELRQAMVDTNELTKL